MESARVCVIDNSPAVRETISIVLGGDYAVRCLSAADYLRNPSSVDDADLLIVADDALPGESTRLLPSGRPILWLQSRQGSSPDAMGRLATLPRWFSPEDLRASVCDLLAHPGYTQSGLHSWSVLEYPVLPKEALALVRRAVATRLPVLICGEPGTGKARLARAIHASSRDGRFVHLSASSCNRAALQQAAGVGPGNLTVYVHDVSGVPVDGQQLLLELLDCSGFASSAGWHGVRLICGTPQSLSDLARVPGLDKNLFYRLSVLPITLPPLRERPEDIPALVNRIATDIARLVATEPVIFTRRAVDRLSRYLWFGNLAELETVLTRTVALAQSRPIDANDLLFGYGRIVPRQPAESPAVQPEVAAEHERHSTVDLIINELAHEFKNPMVTIKTVAQHLERLLADEAGREEVARLTGEAVDRMDRALENLLQFTRFRAPIAREIPLSALLAPCLSDLAPRLSENRVTLDYRPPDSPPVFVDAAQVAYAFDNLLRVVARDLQEGATLCIRPLGPGAGLAFEYPRASQPLASKLSELLDDAGGGGEALPLGLVLARSLIERNGGHIELRSENASTSINVWLPNREGMATGNGKTTNLSS